MQADGVRKQADGARAGSGALFSPNRQELTEEKLRKGGHEGHSQNTCVPGKEGGHRENQDLLQAPHSQLQKVFLVTLSLQPCHQRPKQADLDPLFCRKRESAKHIHYSKTPAPV